MGDSLFKNDGTEKYSLRGKIFSILRQQILDGKYQSGDSLVETKLAEELGVSRTPIREAIRQLELEGLVDSVPNKGVIVKGITEKDIEDIYTIRKVLEGLAAKWAVEKFTEEELTELKDIFDLMEFYTRKNDIEQVAKLNTRFHEVIFKATKSSVLQNILTDFQYYVQWVRYESLRTPGRPQEALEEHKQIIDAFINRDAENAERLVTQHIINSSRNLMNIMKLKKINP
ncbi:HTH-type transcriptional regulator McbR [Oxobacter pfennigii]|uniref:HTH-type transcriptional regulator McbR n=1 Tax=Oxobacter pfennigii TaxID=36849 RepID=A0A0P8W854_9CLOT|nr:GntR family transcriptional regulator [Oxobacter pfennigii]KPU44199.1 HTH-type transcriptional regulator McbR [Oxobacter pfennigii]